MNFHVSEMSKRDEICPYMSKIRKNFLLFIVGQNGDSDDCTSFDTFNIDCILLKTQMGDENR